MFRTWRLIDSTARDGARTICRREHSHGVATLTVVMALFFVMALVAAYLSRNLLFEQRMASSSVRSDRALAAADAGVDWIISMLNSGPIDDACEAHAPDADHPGFRERYLSVNPQRRYAFKLENPATLTLPACKISIVDDSPKMNCVCPKTDGSTQTIAGASASDAAFRIRFDSEPDLLTPPGTLFFTVRGCVNTFTAGESCRPLHPNERVNNDAMTNVFVMVGMLQALPSPPVAALTTGGAIQASTTSLLVSNPDPATGMALHAGGSINFGSGVVRGPAGSVSSPLLASDAKLSALNDNADTRLTFFGAVFGMPSATFADSPAVVKITCPSGGCDLTTLNDAGAFTNFPRRTVVVVGNLNLASTAAAVQVGSNEAPVMLVVTGNLTLNASLNFVGFIYANRVTWTGAASGASVRGAMMVARDFTADASVSMIYDAAVVNTIQLNYGSFVRVPGGWNNGGA